MLRAAWKLDAKAGMARIRKLAECTRPANTMVDGSWQPG
jgi:hypothetical protein